MRMKYKQAFLSLFKTGVLFWVFHFVIGVEIFKVLLSMNFEVFVAGALGAQTALVLFGLTLIGFKKDVLIEMEH